jgi:hypothetical protein
VRVALHRRRMARAITPKAASLAKAPSVRARNAETDRGARAAALRVGAEDARGSDSSRAVRRT